MSRLERYLRYAVYGITDHPRRSPRRRRIYRGPARDEFYRAWVRLHPCCACGSERFVEAAHTGSDGGMREKASDYTCVPLCATCHQHGPRAYHRIGREAFCRLWDVNLELIAKGLYAIWQLERKGLL